MEGRHLPLRAAVPGHTPDSQVPTAAIRYLGNWVGRADPSMCTRRDYSPLRHATRFRTLSALRIKLETSSVHSAPAAHNNMPGQPVPQPRKRRLGSGIYRPAGHTQDGSQEERGVRLDPTGHGITNTINRAELAPIGTQIASDSACSLYQIARMIHKPMYMQQHKHTPLLPAVLAASNS